MQLIPASMSRRFALGRRNSRDIEKDGGHTTVEEPKGLNRVDINGNADPTTEETIEKHRILPILSGVMIPFSIMLSIPGMTGHWYIRTEDNQTVETRPNPLWLDVGMALSMACGVLANACLVFRFSERKIKLMTLAAIAFLTLHDAINIPAITIFGVQHRYDDGFTYGQSFWFTVCSTLVASATNITLIIDFFRIKDFTHSGSGLTPKQRSLVIMIIVLLSYISLGALISGKLLDISFINALYYSVVTIETIGFGDVSPTSTGARVFTCCYISGGILNLGVAVSLARDALVEAAAASFRERLKKHEHVRHVRSRWRAAVRWRLRAEGLPVWVHLRRGEARRHLKEHHHQWHPWYHIGLRIWRKICSAVARRTADPSWRYLHGPHHRRLNVEALTDAQLEAAALEAGAPITELIPEELGLPRNQGVKSGPDVSPHPVIQPNTRGHTEGLTHVRMGGMLTFLGKVALAVNQSARPDAEQNLPVAGTEEDVEDVADDDPDEDDPHAGVDEHGIPLSHDDVQSTTESLVEDERGARYSRIAIALIMFLLFWMVGSAIFMRTENWGFGTAIYFCDLAPRSPAGRSIFVVWALLGVGTMTILISLLSDAYTFEYENVIKRQVQQVTADATANQDEDTGNASPQIIALPASGSGKRLTLVSSSSTAQSGQVLDQRTDVNSTSCLANLQAQSELTAAEPQVEQTQVIPQLLLKHVEMANTLVSRLATERGVNSETVGHPQHLEMLLSQLQKSLNDVEKAARELAKGPSPT